MLEHRIEDREQLAHAGREGDLGRLAGRAQPLIEGGQDEIAAHGRQGAHIERGADLRLPALDGAAPAQGAAIAIERGGPRERIAHGSVSSSPRDPIHSMRKRREHWD